MAARPPAPTTPPAAVPDDGEPFRRRAIAMAKMFEQPLLGLFGLAALVFGFIGYQKYFRATGQPSNWVDVLYADIQLIKLSSRVNTANVPWELNVGRLLAPAVTGYTAFRGIVVLYSDRFDRLRIQMLRRHVVVVGATAAGIAVARALTRSGRRVVLVDQAMTPDRVASMRSIRVLTIVGDGTRPEVLHLARVHRAREVLALTDDDTRNVDVTLRARLLADREGRTTRTMGSVSRSDVCELLRIESIHADGPPRTDFFNAPELTARAVHRLIEGRADGPGDDTEGADASDADRDGDVVIMAPVADGAQLAARLVRHGHRGTIRLAGADAAATLSELTRRRIGSDRSPSSITAEPELVSLEGVRHAVVIGTATAALAPALDLAHRLANGAMVIAVLPDPSHLGPLATDTPGSGRVPIRLVDSLAWWRDTDLVLGGAVEVIARATHESYIDTRRAAGSFTDGDPSLVPWHQLAANLRASNRDQARHVWVKLAATNCSLAPAGPGPDTFAFTREEIDLLARLEHDRWVAERRADGWVSGERDIDRKTSPYLVGWADLTEEIRDLDRAAAWNLPAFVADLGYRIVRLPAPTSLPHRSIR